MENPVYRCTAPNGTVFALMCMRVGAPSACGIMEEMIPHGVKKFLMLGSCGALDHAITARAHSGALRRHA